jgi:hypothetical protein
MTEPFPDATIDNYISDYDALRRDIITRLRRYGFCFYLMSRANISAEHIDKIFEEATSHGWQVSLQDKMISSVAIVIMRKNYKPDEMARITDHVREMDWDVHWD